MTEEWLALLDKENAATVSYPERLLVTMWNLLTALYWLEEAPINSMKYQLRAAAHIVVQYEENLSIYTKQLRSGGVTEAIRAVTYPIDHENPVEIVVNFHVALESLYGAWYDSKYVKEDAND